MRQKFFNDRVFHLRVLFVGPDFFLQSVVPLLERREIGQHQLGVDHFDVANRIDRRADVMDIRVRKAAHHLDNRVYFADVMEKLVAESFARARAFDQTGDIHKLDRSRHNFFRARHLAEFFQPRIGHANYANVGIDCAKGIIFRWRVVRPRNRIEQRRFADVRKSNNSSAEHPFL